MRHIDFTILKKRTPMLYQAEASECGLICLLMIMHHHGNFLSIQSGREKLKLGNVGVTLGGLQASAEQEGFNSRLMLIESDDLSRLILPAILHWNNNHFVVLTKVTDKSIFINDPALGSQKIRRQDISRHFGGKVLELHPNRIISQKKNSENLVIKDLFPIVKLFKRSIFVNLVLSVFAQIFVLSFPVFYHLVINRVIGHGDEDLLGVIVSCFVGLALFHYITSVVRAREELYLSSHMILRFTESVIKHLFNLPLKYFESRKSGSILSRLTATRSLEKTFISQIFGSIVDSMLSLIIFAIVLIYSYQLALIVVISVLSYLVVTYFYSKKITSLDVASFSSGADERIGLAESINAIQTVKLYSNQNAQISDWKDQYIRTLNCNIENSQASIFYKNTTEFIFALEKIAIVYFATQLTFNNQFTVGEFFAIFLYGNMLTARIQALTATLITLKVFGARLNKVADILNEEREINDETRRTQKSLVGAIKLNKVSYSFSKTDKPVFSNVTININPGETVVFIGPSGCGKTTLMKVMLGLYEPTKGAVGYDNKPLKYLDMGFLRHQIATVMQDDVLITGSIESNIALFDNEPDFERIKDAAHQAMIASEIEKMPMGYQTKVRQIGCFLSGGQRQRILLARALYKKPKILFLDEGTAFLNSELEVALNENLKKLPITKIFIAHKAELIKSADRVFSFKNNSFVEETL